jgi:hypothetical protein
MGGGGERCRFWIFRIVAPPLGDLRRVTFGFCRDAQGIFALNFAPGSAVFALNICFI